MDLFRTPGRLFGFLLGCTLLAFSAGDGGACSAVFEKQHDVRLVGRTMDWPAGDGYVALNERGIAKTALFLQDKSAPAEWTSRYGSLTFNLVQEVKGYGRMSCASCGMNERGLWAGSLWIHPPPAVAYPPADHRKSINDWQWLQYLLDTCGSVAEVIKRAADLRVSWFSEGGFEVDLHWFVADGTGDAAMVEFPDGKLDIRRAPVPAAMTNSFYDTSRRYLAGYAGFGGAKPLPEPGEQTSLNRFANAAHFLQKKSGKSGATPNAVFEIMAALAQTGEHHASTSDSVTQWTTVYDLKTRRVFWKTRANAGIRMVHLGKLDFVRTGKVRSLDLADPAVGSVEDRFATFPATKR